MIKKHSNGQKLSPALTNCIFCLPPVDTNCYAELLFGLKCLAYWHAKCLKSQRNFLEQKMLSFYVFSRGIGTPFALEKVSQCAPSAL